MDLTNVSFPLALVITFSAGIVSFISPCVLPLVPAYIGYMGGRVTHRVASQVASGEKQKTPSFAARFSTFRHGVAFVAGFTFVFVTLGLALTAFISIFGEAGNVIRDILARVGGIVIIFFGLHFMGVIPSFISWLRKRDAIVNSIVTTLVIAIIFSLLILWGFVKAAIALPVLVIFLAWLLFKGAFTRPGEFWLRVMDTIEMALYADTRRQMNASGKEGVAGSAFMGIVFAAGWTPCIGPVYGAVLNLAISGTGTDIAQAGVLLTAYSLGLGIPFLLMTVLLDSAQGVLRKLQSRMQMIEIGSGALLILIGIIVAGGQLQSLSEVFSSSDFGDVSVALDEKVVNLFTGEDTEAESAGSEMSDTGSIEALAANSAARVGLAVGNLAPDFSTTLDTGESITLSELRGQIVLLNFWATWCGPCRGEMDDFEAAFQQHGGNGFTVLAVNNRETVEEVVEFREEMSLSFPLALDEKGDIQDQYSVISYPTTYVLDQNGVIIERYLGAMTDAQIQALVNAAGS